MGMNVIKLTGISLAAVSLAAVLIYAVFGKYFRGHHDDVSTDITYPEIKKIEDDVTTNSQPSVDIEAALNVLRNKESTEQLRIIAMYEILTTGRWTSEIQQTFISDVSDMAVKNNEVLKRTILAFGQYRDPLLVNFLIKLIKHGWVPSERDLKYIEISRKSIGYIEIALTIENSSKTLTQSEKEQLNKIIGGDHEKK